MRTSLILRSLCLVGVVLLQAGCSIFVAGTSPEADHATLAMRTNPERYILVTVENEPTAMQTRAGSTTRGYDTAVRYKVSSRARATVQSLSSTYQLREVRSWPIPALRVHTMDVSCSGMAGTFGLNADNYPTSLQAGRPMLDELKRPRVLFGSTECSTCRMQMEDGGGKRTLHPAQYLALAYGLLPEVARRLREPIGELLLR